MAKPSKNRTPVKTHGRRMTRKARIQAPRKQRRYVSYTFSIRKVRTSLRPKFAMSTLARRAMSSFVKYLCEKMVIEAGKRMLRDHRKIVTSRDIKSAIYFLLPKGLTKHALLKDNKALGNYNLRKPNQIKRHPTTPGK